MFLIDSSNEMGASLMLPSWLFYGHISCPRSPLPPPLFKKLLGTVRTLAETDGAVEWDHGEAFSYSLLLKM
jgi:hypothetical protein